MSKKTAGPEIMEPEELVLHNFVSKIGEQVRKARHKERISRRVLSDRSGVSERYLAQLESGNGNISVVVLFKVAQALGKEPGWFLEDAPFSDSSDELVSLVRSASPEVQEDIRNQLIQASSTVTKQKRLCLIGLRGAGKSTLGKFAAKKLSYEFIELNDAIERQAGIPVSEIMALYGQEGYRELEKAALDTIIESRSKVLLAVGGGVVSEPETYRSILSNFHTIWLKASPQEHMERVRKQGDQRPMAGNPRAMEDLMSILLTRESLYQKADILVDTSGKELAESKADLLKVLKRLGA